MADPRSLRERLQAFADDPAANPTERDAALAALAKLDPPPPPPLHGRVRIYRRGSHTTATTTVNGSDPVAMRQALADLYKAAGDLSAAADRATRAAKLLADLDPEEPRP